LDWVNEKYVGRLLELLNERSDGHAPALSLLIGSRRSPAPRLAPQAPVQQPPAPQPKAPEPVQPERQEPV
ncbi:MAG TPA: chromosomal replication initiator protein DnaA, partial [Pseudomonas sp.]|nr:chromosomal replication initiator protein DnaA [Pseudomonas sp.]